MRQALLPELRNKRLGFHEQQMGSILGEVMESDKRESMICKYGLILKPQEIPIDHPDSRYYFNTEPYLATPNALQAYNREIITECLTYLQKQARQYKGLDYLQVFEDLEKKRPNLWFIDDGDGGATTALLPDDY